MEITQTVILAGLAGICIGYIGGKSDERSRIQKQMRAMKARRESQKLRAKLKETQND
jgi:hypothetical protein